MPIELLHKIERLEKVILSGKLGRFSHAPLRWLSAGIWRDFIYSIIGAGWKQSTTLITGDPFHLKLPAGIDLYLFGMKSDPSEIRLTKFITTHLNEGSTFIDVGAHLGFYTLLAKHISGPNGKIHAFEPSPEIFHFLKRNTSSSSISIVNKAVSNSDKMLEFALHPLLYSEFNSLKTSQIKHSAKLIKVAALRLDNYCEQTSLSPDMIKIDVEGAESEVIEGSEKILQAGKCVFITEVRKDQLDSVSLNEMITRFTDHHYKSYKILADGKIENLPDLSAHVNSTKEDSDNIVFMAN